MKKHIIITLLIAATAVTAKAQTYLNPQSDINQRVEDALSRMTTHEKIMILHAQSKFTSAGVPRLGIRQLNMDDGPHGVREELEWNSWKAAQWTNDYVVAFPSLTCLASTWNRDLSLLYGKSVGEEFAFRGKDVLLGPGVNIARTPLNGRAFEYMGEDPLLAGEMVVPYIQGAQKNGVACCLKHFCLNDQETDRFGVNVNVSERALREIYLAPFEYAVKKAGVWSIMGSYPFWEGTHMCQHDHLLNGILKQEWGFDGAVVSDWGGVTDTWQAVTGGLDIEMGTYTDGKLKESDFGYNDYYLANNFEQLIAEGKVPMSVLDEKARRVLRLIFRTSMNPDKVIGSQCSEAHYEACLQIAEEGIVLLRNEKAGKKNDKASLPLLPLDITKYKSILVVGENATRSLTQGGGSSELKTLRDISPLDGLRTLLPKLNPHVSIDYAQGYASGRAMYDKVDIIDPSTQARLKAEALEKAKVSDLIIYIGGMNKNSRQDCENGDRESYDLSFGQNELISELADIQSNIVVVTFGGNAYAMPWLDKAPAIVHCWYLGSEAGTALANLLTGKVCPSGKLPVTFARNYSDYPYVKYGEEAYPGKVTGKGGPTTPRSEVFYKEDIFVGYRGFEKNKTKPLFPFGFGLSYTTFAYSNVKITSAGNNVFTMSADITNTGSCEGKETVQLYIGLSKPKDRSQANRPVKELKDFAKVSLKPGETKSVAFSFSASDLRCWDEQSHSWQTLHGRYKAYISSSSADIRGTADFDI